MSAVPSLVGAGTVVAAAAAGLIIGQTATESSTPPHTSHKRKLTAEFASPRAPIPGPTSSRPSTSVNNPVIPAASTRPSVDSYMYTATPARIEPPPVPSGTLPRQPRPSGTQPAQTTPPKVASRRHSFIRQPDHNVPPIAEHARDSISSNGSWMRRLSVRPLSQHGSARSSIFGPDSPSINLSLGSAAPILSPVGSLPSQLPPNKLVKRATSGIAAQPGSLSRRGSRSQMPTLRRPATSHQRSATLQQFQPQGAASSPAGPFPKYSLEQHISPRFDPSDIPSEIVETPGPAEISTDDKSSLWASFFHSRTVKSVHGNRVPRSYSASPNNAPLPHKRIHLQPGSIPQAFLISPNMLANERPASEKRHEPGHSRQLSLDTYQSPIEAKDASPAAEETPAKRARRSISMHFSSPTSWIARSGSIRRLKRGAPETKSGKRYVSAPVVPGAASQVGERQRVEDLFNLPGRPREAMMPSEDQPQTSRRRNASSPLPPLSRLSSFNIDLARLGISTPSPSTATRPGQPSHSGPFGPSPTSPVMPQSRGVSRERTFTMGSADQDNRDFASADEDDTDFKSDTMFDSFRTMASTRVKSVETPLESMFDESPPSTAGNSKTKRLSIQEMLGPQWDGGTRIIEEDEGLSTPVRDAHPTSGDEGYHHRLSEDMDDDFTFEATSLPLRIRDGDFGRLSLDADEDDDWIRDDENALSNHLSPPSSINSRNASRSHRTALANISGNGSPVDNADSIKERPQSKLFEWSEAPAHDKVEPGGSSPRPKTVHGQQEMDLRGGRSANRKGPTATHVRSQSVPVVVDPSEPANKAAPKYGTWGLSSKPASEDWEDDFDFGAGGPVQMGGGSSARSVVVPASIQATQVTIKAHSGQIRELSLLVNDLKRLCRHGRDLDLLDSKAASKWEEAENIIALASPDEELTEDVEKDVPMAAHVNGSETDGQFLGGAGFDPMALDTAADSRVSEDAEARYRSEVRDGKAVRRRSVFGPDDDIFGGALPAPGGEATMSDRPSTPPSRRTSDLPHDSAVIASVMEAMQQQRSASESMQYQQDRYSSSSRPPQQQQQDTKLFFDTNSLQELVKRASQLRDFLSDLVCEAEPFTQSPVGTPRRERQRQRQQGESSPAFTRVFSNKIHAMTVN